MKWAIKTIATVPLSSKGGRLKATSRPRPIDTDGTALGMKKRRSRTRPKARGTVRSASADHVPTPSANTLAIIPVRRLA